MFNHFINMKTMSYIYYSFYIVTSNTDLLSDLDSLNTSSMRLPDGRISSPNNSNIFIGMNNAPSNTVNYAGERTELRNTSFASRVNDIL